MEAIGGLAIASSASAFTIVAALSAIAGAVLLIYVLFFTKPPPLVQKFVDDYAKKAGYAMPLKSAIDYFQINPDDTLPQVVGITIGRDGAVVRMDPQRGGDDDRTGPLRGHVFSPGDRLSRAGPVRGPAAERHR